MLVRELIALLVRCPHEATIDAECSGCIYGFDAVSISQDGKSCTLETRGEIENIVADYLQFPSHEKFKRFPPPDILYFQGPEIRKRTITIDDLNAAIERVEKNASDEAARRLSLAVSTVQRLLASRGRDPLSMSDRWTLHYGGFLDFPNADSFTALATETVPELAGLNPGDFRQC